MLIPFGLILPKMTNTTNTQVFITIKITSQKQSNKKDYSLLSDTILVAYLINLNLTFIMKFCHPKKLIRDFIFCFFFLCFVKIRFLKLLG